MMRCFTYALVLAAFLCSGAANAADMGVIDIADFSGGLNTRDGVGGISDNELTESFNCYLNGKAIASRNGYASYADSTRIDDANPGTGITEATFSDSTRIVAFAGSKAAWDSSGTWVDITGAITLTADIPVITAMVNDNLVVVNGTDSAAYWSGDSTFIALSGANIPTKPVACAEYKGRLFLAQGRTLYWSEYSGAWKTFHPDDYQPFEEDITGMHVYGYGTTATLVVFTRRGVHACIFDPSIGESIGGRGAFRFEVITTKHGCISPYSVEECQAEDGSIVLVWADADGVKALTGGNAIVRLTDRIQPTWDGLSKTLLAKSVGIHYTQRRWYLLTCGEDGETENNRVIVYDLRNFTVAGIFDWPVSAIGVVRVDGTDKLVGSNYSGYWYTYDSGTNDAGTSIDAYFTTKSYDGGSPLYDKGFLSVGIQHEYLGSSQVDVTAFFDASETSYSFAYEATEISGVLDDFVLDVDRLYSLGGLVITGREIHGRGRSAMITVRGQYADEPFKIYRLQIPYEIGRMVIAR